MAGIEDFVVEQIIQDFQQTPAAPPPAASAAPAESSFTADAKYNYLANRGAAPGAVSDPSAPRGFTIADPAARDRYAQFEGQQNAAATTGGALERGMKERDMQRFKVLEGLRGLDPQIQGTILKRLGIDPGPIQSHVQQQKEILQFKDQLERPQQEVANAIKMMLATQGGQHNAAQLQFNRQKLDEEQASRAQTQNIQLMRTLAVLMQSDASGKMQQVLAPILMQMMQSAGINLAPGGGASTGGGKSSVKITRE